MESRSFTDWDQVRQTLDRLVEATKALRAVESVNLRVGKLRLQLVPCARSVRVLGLPSAEGLRLPAGVTVVQTYTHHVHYLIDGFTIVENRPAPQPQPQGLIHVA